MDAIEGKVRNHLFEEKIVESRVRWFGYVKRKPIEALIRKVIQMEDSPLV